MPRVTFRRHLNGNVIQRSNVFSGAQNGLYILTESNSSRIFKLIDLGSPRLAEKLHGKMLFRSGVGFQQARFNVEYVLNRHSFLGWIIQWYQVSFTVFIGNYG